MSVLKGGGMKTAICKGCGADLIWAMTSNGKLMPLNAKKTNVGYEVEVINDKAVCVPIKGHLQHWATCSKAADFKQKKGGD